MRLPIRAMQVVVLLASISALIACGDGRLPTSPTAVANATTSAASSADPQEATPRSRPTSPGGPESVSVVQIGPNSVDLEVTWPDNPTPVLLSIRTADGAEPVFSFDGQVTELIAPPDERSKPTILPAVLAAAAVAIRAYAVVEVIRVCAPPLYSAIRSNSLTAQTWDSCVWTAASNVAGSSVAKYVAGVGVTRIRSDIYDALKGAVSWSDLRGVLNKKTFKSSAEIVSELTARFFDAIYRAIYGVFQRY